MVAGVLTGVIVLLRQLTGVWVAMGLLSVALFEREGKRVPRQGGWLARFFFVVMLAASLWNLSATPETEPGGVLLIAVWPLAILVRGLVRGRTSDAAVAGQPASWEQAVCCRSRLCWPITSHTGRLAPGSTTT